MRATDPAQIIAIYQGIVGLQPDRQLPYGVSFTAMIEAILDYEEREGDFV